MDDVDLQLNFAMCFDHFQHNDLAKDDQYKTPLGSKDSSPNGNESESIEVVETPSNPYKGPLQESTISSASTNNTDICVLDSQYANEDLQFLPDDDDLEEREFFESDEADEVFVRAVDVLDKNEEFTMLQKPVKSRRLCNCEESTEVLMLINSEYQGKRKTTYSGTDSDVEVLMSEEITESDWSSGNNEEKMEKSISCESMSDIKHAQGITPCSQKSCDGGSLHKETSAGLDVSGPELCDNVVDSYQNLNRPQLLQIILQQEERIQALEVTVEQYHKAQQRLFEHVDALRLELSEIRISPMQETASLPEEWQTFFEAYTSTTAEFGYSNLHNIMRLRESLKGRARETVESLLGSSANVTAILEILQETFGRPEQLIKSQIEKVRAIPSLTNDNLDALVNFANKILNMSTFLQNAQGGHHLSNPSLLSELVSKMSTNRQMQWAEKCLLLERPATIIDFSNWLSTLRRLANIVHDSLPSTSTAGSRRQPAPTAPHSRKFAYTTVHNNCPICQGECENIKKCHVFSQMSVNERWNKIKDLKVCFCCLRQGHQLQMCHSKKRCNIDNCTKSHNRLLHQTFTDRREKRNNTNVPETQQITTEVAHTRPPSQEGRNCHVTSSNDGVLFQMLPVQIYGAHKVVSTYAFVDDGANVSMIDSNLARELDLHGKPEILELQWLNEHSIAQQTEKINITISGVERNNKKYTISNVYITPHMSLPVQSCQMANILKARDSQKIANLKLRDYANIQPKLILSLNHAFLTVPLKTPRQLTAYGPFVNETRLGAIIYGPMPGEKSTSNKTVLHIRGCFEEKHGEMLQELNNMMRGYFDVESLGVKSNVKQLISKDNERALTILKNTTRKIDGRYECRLLWRENVHRLPDSYQMALHRLYSVERKMEKDHVYAKQYREKIENYVKNGYARKLSEEEKSQQHEKIFYLPHFGVKNINKNGIRLVFDAAAEVQKMSLNKALIPGPDINNSLISILLKFREAPIAVCGDIKEMFHQVAIAKGDQNSQRFLWRNGDPDQLVDTYVMERLIFGATCSPVIAQYVKNYNANQFLSESPRAVHGIVERHYVDDYVDCFQSEQEAAKVVKKVIEIHKAGGFELRGITSNSDYVKKSCGNILDKVDGHHLCNENTERVLGVYWTSKPDVFCFVLKFDKVDAKILNFEKIPTKREMLSLNMSIYDPFGFICDFMVTSKVLMQRVWKAGINWDDKLPPEIYGRWKTWMEELKKVKEFSVPRCYGLKFKSSKVDLHVFADASEEAMAVVAYWRVVSADCVNVVFVMGKSSCAPTRFHTTPKLELQAATMGVRLKDLIIKNHLKEINNVFFWTDSHTVIQWIRSDHCMYKQFVANRVAEILEGSSVKDWRWCPGAENPADEATRAKYSKNYRADGRWKNGPEFLKKHESEWPKEQLMGQCLDSCKTELRSKHRVLVMNQVRSCVPNINRFSIYRRLKRTMAWVLRYVANVRFKAQEKELVRGDLTVEEETKAERYLCRYVQDVMYPDEKMDLKRNGSVSTTSVLKCLNPLIDNDGLMRVSGRIENAAFLCFDAKRPIILPKNHQFTRLLVESYHRRFCHINTATTMSEIRQRFWVPSLRQLLKSVQSQCQVCRIRKAKPRQPQMAPLPVDRVTPFVRAFSYTGLDYFGPVNVSVGRRREKRWVALFTCLSVRAVHLEVANDLSSDACLLCVKNFVNRRGVPMMIRSDNGTNFVGIAKELQGVSNFLDNSTFSSGLTALGIKWCYNTPLNPSEGGAWERLVQSIKKALYAMLKEQAPRPETLQSFLIEAENIVNSRPLTHLPVTPDDPEPLTPNHFLLGCTNSTQTPAPYEPRLMCLRKQWRVLENIKNGMWHRWIREYLPELTRRTKWCLPSQPLTIGSLVFICDANEPRSKWRRGRVIELYVGKDGVARSAEVRTSSGLYRRPVSKLAVLDVEDGMHKSESFPSGSVHGGGDVADGNPGINNI